MAARKRKQVWSIGDVFSIALDDGDVVLAQIVGREAEVLNSVSIGLFDLKCKPDDVARASTFLDVPRLFSVLFVTRDLLDLGVWKIVGRMPVSIPRDMQPYENLRKDRFIGAKVIGSGIVVIFVHAFYGLRPWDDFHDPDYLDRLLLTPAKKPKARLVYKAR